MSIARYYAWLSRFQDAARGLAHDTGQETLTVHRHLRGDDGTVSGDVLHARVLDAVMATGGAPDDVLDAGCGLGGTTFYLQSRLGGRYTGITLSDTQCARATAEAMRRGLGEVCRFAVRDYDEDLTDLLPTGVDLIVAIESLAHAPDPAATVARLAARLRPGGRLLLVDDVPRDTLPWGDADFTGFRAGWLCPAVAADTTLATALAAAGLTVCHDEDLTPRVRARHRAALAGLVLVARAAAALLALTPAGVLMGALLGGLRLERMYQRGVVRYRLLVAARAAGGHTPTAG
ncbi:MAG: methyltransferase domain-containing protein [Acidobacteria bacterium]|nr:methyltransferase domain-containing protein [Acidobacteriota bacterium]